MIYRWDDICESREFEHDQKFVKAEHWKEACDEVDDLIKTKKYLQAENKKLRDALEFYASYKNDDPDDDYNYDVAREALKE